MTSNPPHHSGTKGQRYSLPNGSIMLHQPRSLARGQASDIAIKVRKIRYTTTAAAAVAL
jgi:ATP-dependent Clp protease protease subunit